MVVKKSVILAIGQLIQKIFGLIFIYMLSHYADDLSIYTKAYLVFSLFNDIATLGLIPGTSKIVANLERDEEAGFLYFGRKLTIWIGVFFFILYLICIKPSANLTLNDDYFSLFLAGISLVFVPRLYFNKGYLQGQMRMLPSAISLVVEGGVRIAVIGIVILLGGKYIEYFSLASNFIATGFANLILHFAMRKEKSKKGKSYLVSYFNLCLPYGMTTLFFTLYQAVDTFTLKRLLEGSENASVIANAYLYQANRLYYLPIMIASSFAASLIPSFKEKQKETIHHVFTYLNAILVFFFGIYFLYAKEIYFFVYKEQEIGYLILKRCLPLILILGFYKVILGMLHAIGSVKTMVCCTWGAFLIKYLLNKALVTKLGYVGAYYSTLLCALVLILCGIFVLYKRKILLLWNFTLSLSKYFLHFILATCIFLFLKKNINSWDFIFSAYWVQIVWIAFFYVLCILFNLLWKFNQNSGIMLNGDD